MSLIDDDEFPTKSVQVNLVIHDDFIGSDDNREIARISRSRCRCRFCFGFSFGSSVTTMTITTITTTTIAKVIPSHFGPLRFRPMIN